MNPTIYPLPRDLPPDPEPGGIPYYPDSLIKTCEWLINELIRKNAPIYRDIPTGYAGKQKARLMCQVKGYKRGEPTKVNEFVLKHYICPDHGIRFRVFNRHVKRWEAAMLPAGITITFVGMALDGGFFPQEFRRTVKRNRKAGAL